MADFAAIDDSQTFWLVAISTLLHEIGVPVPMMPTALFAGARAAGAADLLAAVGAVVVATLIGNSVWFAAGRRYGGRVLKLLCRLSLSADTCVSRTETVFGRWGWSSIVVGRFLPGVSLVAPPLAGALGMRWSRFLVLTAAGAALYGFVVVLAGMLLQRQIEAALRALDGSLWQVIGVGLALIAAYVSWRWWRRWRAARKLDVPRLSVDELQALIAAGEAPLVVDVRGATAQQVDPRRIPGALAVDLDALETDLADLPRDRHVVLYCACPNEASAAKAAQLLLSKGYGKARPLRGGLDAWIAAGLAVEHAPSAAAPGAPLSASAARA